MKDNDRVVVILRCAVVFSSYGGYITLKEVKEMKKSVLKICSLVFALLCLAGLVAILCTSVTLPYTETYRVWGTTYTQHYSGCFNAAYLDAVILTAMGAFWGFVLFFSLPCGKCRKAKDEEKPEEKNCGCGCDGSPESQNS